MRITCPDDRRRARVGTGTLDRHRDGKLHLSEGAKSLTLTGMPQRTKKGKTAPHSWKPGDSVRLKTGKLPMTVFKVKEEIVTCHLEVEDTIKEKTFHSAMPLKRCLTKNWKNPSSLK